MRIIKHQIGTGLAKQKDITVLATTALQYIIAFPAINQIAPLSRFDYIISGSTIEKHVGCIFRTVTKVESFTRRKV